MAFAYARYAVSRTVTRRHWLGLASGAVALAMARRSYAAQGYPLQPIRILVGFAAGGNFDLVARTLGSWLSDHFRQTLVVENRPGAGGNIATEAVARAPTDGYTLLLGGAVNAVNATLYDKLPFNFIRDLAPVSGVVRFPNVLTVNASVPVTSVPELIAYLKAHPGKANQGSSGNGTTQHLAGELFKAMAGVEFAHIPYRGAGQAIADLLGGQVQLLFESLPASIPHIKAGKLRALAVTSAARSEALPDIPTVGESLAGYEASGWTGVFAPRDTPSGVVESLNRAINASLGDAAISARFAELGATRMPGSNTDFGKVVVAETEKWGKVIRAGNIKPT